MSPIWIVYFCGFGFQVTLGNYLLANFTSFYQNKEIHPLGMAAAWPVTVPYYILTELSILVAGKGLSHRRARQETKWKLQQELEKQERLNAELEQEVKKLMEEAEKELDRA